MRATKVWIAAGIVAACLCLAPFASEAADTRPLAAAIPDFSGVWSRAWPQPQLFEPPDLGPGPVTGDPASPHIHGANSPWIADLTNPILRPQTRARLKELAEQQRAGHALQDNDTLCLPLGVLATLNLFDAMQVLQAPTQVTFLYARDHQVRTAYLNGRHFAGAKPSWYGDSIAHYDGDTLVVDTVGMNDKTLVDRYGTPHSGSLHTVERYRLLGDALEVTVTVEDPVVFTTPWTAKAAYKRERPSAFEEIVCAENNRPAGQGGLQIPTATRPDF